MTIRCPGLPHSGHAEKDWTCPLENGYWNKVVNHIDRVNPRYRPDYSLNSYKAESGLSRSELLII